MSKTLDNAAVFPMVSSEVILETANDSRMIYEDEWCSILLIKSLRKKIIFHNFLHSSKASASQIRLQRFGDKKGNPLSFFKPESFLEFHLTQSFIIFLFMATLTWKGKFEIIFSFSDETEFKGSEEYQEIQGTGSEDYSPTNILVNYFQIWKHPIPSILVTVLPMHRNSHNGKIINNNILWCFYSIKICSTTSKLWRLKVNWDKILPREKETISFLFS